MIKNKLFNRHWLIIIYCLIGSISILVLAGYFAERNAVTQANDRMQGTLAFQTEALKTNLEKYTLLAALISRRPSIVLALLARNPLEILPNANQLSLNYIGISGANDIWIADREGNILRKNQLNDQPVNINSDNYFKSAMQGNLGRGNVVTPSGKRLYIIASPVFYKNKILGVVVVRLNLEDLEQVLLLLPDPILMVDVNQRVLLSNVRSWRLRYFNYPREKISNIKRAVDRENNFINKNFLISRVSHASVNKLTFKEALRENDGRVFLQASQYIALLDWHVHTFVNYDGIRSQRNNVVLITFLLLMLITMSFLMWRAHQKRRLKEHRSQLAFSLRLERQVRDRTHDLSASNLQLNSEIVERRHVEINLREAQDELIQAAKLAGIGQMSTALAHEYNQPLTAIRSYADNTSTFIEKDDLLGAIENLQRIKLLVDKMSGFTRTLRRFAHKSTNEYEHFSVDSVMDELIILLSPQAKKQNVSLQLCSPKEIVYLKGEQGKLLQIITNLVTNAMDAVADCTQRQVEIQWCVTNTKRLHENDRFVFISIKDTGEGISSLVKKDMFNAFYTTKKTGNGLGLGLFIVSTLLNDFKGTIRLKKNTDGSPHYKTVFELRLPLVDLNKK